MNFFFFIETLKSSKRYNFFVEQNNKLFKGWQKVMEIPDTSILEVNLLNKTDSITIESDDQIELIVKALSSRTRRRILQHIQIAPLDVTNIALNLKMTEANISAQIKKLEKAGLINCDYASGDHGVRKISNIKFNKLVIKF